MQHPKADEFYARPNRWQQEMQQLRALVLDCGLTEDYKWGVPCYTHKGKNIVLIHGFKEYCALNFFKGALLQDTDGLLIQQTENSQSTRQIRFTNTEEINEQAPCLKAYLYQAIEVEKAGLQVGYKSVDDFAMPEEFQQKLAESPELKAAFDALTPGRQKAYLLHFGGAKQSKTRADRVEKYRQRILEGFGITDCVCGLSKRMPNCDGSHKQLKPD